MIRKRKFVALIRCPLCVADFDSLCLGLLQLSLVCGLQIFFSYGFCQCCWPMKLLFKCIKSILFEYYYLNYINFLKKYFFLFRFKLTTPNLREKHLMLDTYKVQIFLDEVQGNKNIWTPGVYNYIFRYFKMYLVKIYLM